VKFFETLRRYRKNESELWSVIQRINEMREIAGFPQTGDISTIKVQKSGDSSTIAYIAKINELSELQKRLEEYSDNIRSDLERFLDKIENHWTRQVVEMRMMSKKRWSWKEIAGVTCYSE